MKEFEKLILGNLHETVIAPALTRVASVSVSHPNAVNASVSNIGRTIRRSTFVQSGSQQANQMNHNVTNRINASGSQNIGNNHLNNIFTNHQQISQNSANADTANGNERPLPNHIVQSQQRKKILNGISQHMQNAKPVLNDTKKIGQSILNTLVNQLQ